MKSAFAILGRLETVMKVLAACCLMGMALLTGADVLGRGLFKMPVFGSEEIVTILATLALALSLPYSHSQRVHIGVELFVSRLTRRTRSILKLVTDLGALGLFVLVSWRMLLYGDSLKRSGVVSMNLELPEYYVVYVLAFGFLIFSLTIAADVVRLLQKGGD